MKEIKMMNGKVLVKEDKTLARKLFKAIEASYTREDHKIICPVCGNEIKKITLGDRNWEYICQTEGCIQDRAFGL